MKWYALVTLCLGSYYSDSGVVAMTTTKIGPFADEASAIAAAKAIKDQAEDVTQLDVSYATYREGIPLSEAD